MTNLEFKGDWNVTKGKVKQKFGILTDRDVVLVEGKYEEMLGKLQLILGRTKEELHKIITEL